MANIGTQLEKESLDAIQALVEERLKKGSALHWAKKYGCSGEAIRKAKEGTAGRSVLERILAYERLSHEQLIEHYGTGKQKSRATVAHIDRLDRLAAYLGRSAGSLALRPDLERSDMAGNLPPLLRSAAMAAAQLYDCSFEQAILAASAAYTDLGPKNEWLAEHWLPPIKERIDRGASSGTRPAVRGLKVK